MKRFVSLLSTLLLIVLALGVVTIAVPRIFGVKMFVVLGSSMEPNIHVGDLVYVFPTDYEDIKVGDVVTFVIGEELTVATHRVIAKDEANEKLTTKGDHNWIEDGPISYKNVVGVVKIIIPKGGYVFNFLSAPAGKISTVTVTVSLILFIFAFSEDKEKPKKKDESKDESTEANEKSIP